MGYLRMKDNSSMEIREVVDTGDGYVRAVGYDMRAACYYRSGKVRIIPKSEIAAIDSDVPVHDAKSQPKEN